MHGLMHDGKNHIILGSDDSKIYIPDFHRKVINYIVPPLFYAYNKTNTSRRQIVQRGYKNLSTQEYMLAFHLTRLFIYRKPLVEVLRIGHSYQFYNINSTRTKAWMISRRRKYSLHIFNYLLPRGHLNVRRTPYSVLGTLPKSCTYQ